MPRGDEDSLGAPEKKILIVTGEASGDLHGAEVVRALRTLLPETKVFAVGGEKLRLAGAEILADSGGLAVVGVTEVFSRLAGILRTLSFLKGFLRRRKPDLLILVDYPEFNLRLARFARNEGIPVLYYIGPQVWAWRPGRLKILARVVEKMAVIFPFEVPLYEEAGVPVEFVGHPLLDVMGEWEKPAAAEGKKFPAGNPRIALLPGSRLREISSLLPEMIRAARILKKEKPGAKFLLPLAPGIAREAVDPFLSGTFFDLTVLEGETYAAVAASDLAVVASGTATLETALLKTPMIIVYRTSYPTYWLGRMMIRVGHIGLPNLLAGGTVVPELIQKEARGERIAEEALKILNDGLCRSKMVEALAGIRSRLGKGGAAAGVSRIALEILSAETGLA